MEQLTFNDVTELAEYMIDQVADKHFVTAALFFDDAKELMRSLLMYDDIEIGTIEISDFEYSGYTDEYYVSLLDDHTLSVEMAFKDNRYLATDAEVLLIDGDAKYEIVRRNDFSECFEIQIDDDADFAVDIDLKLDIDDDIDDLIRAYELLYDIKSGRIKCCVDREKLFRLLF